MSAGHSRKTVARQLDELAAAVRAVRLNPALVEGIGKLAAMAAECLESGGKVLACGNGGSATDAAHLVEELVGRYRADRPALSAVLLSGDAGAMTCIANDYGFDRVFSRQVEALGRKGDLLVVFSTSGKSPNIIRALDAARDRGVRTAAILGRDGGAAASVADLALVVPNEDTARIQELHTFILHTVCESLEPL